MRLISKVKVTVSTGLALFAMFFGAGNMIFPLKVGALAGDHTLLALLAFIISGVGVPFLGVFAVSLYHGNYWKFFNRIGKPLAFIVVTFLILIIGPLFAAPRTEVITYHTLQFILPGFLNNPLIFDILYFSFIFILVYKQSRIVDIIGWFFSPIKIIAFSILILLGIFIAAPTIPVPTQAHQIFTTSLTMGYGTMDLLAAFFFCAVAYKNIATKCEEMGSPSEPHIMRMILFACLIGALLISFTYTGLIFAAASHAQALANVPTEELISKISYLILGKYGALFVAICVSVACLATATTLAEVTTDYLYRTLFRQKISRLICLISVLVTMILMAILGFDGIMKIASPILNILYPALILLCIVNIYLKLNQQVPFTKNISVTDLASEKQK